MWLISHEPDKSWVREFASILPKLGKEKAVMPSISSYGLIPVISDKVMSQWRQQAITNLYLFHLQFHTELQPRSSSTQNWKSFFSLQMYVAIAWMKKCSVHEHPHKKNAPVVPHSLPWERTSLCSAPIYNIIPIIRGTQDLDEECTCWKKPSEEQFIVSITSVTLCCL